MREIRVVLADVSFQVVHGDGSVGRFRPEIHPFSDNAWYLVPVWHCLLSQGSQLLSCTGALNMYAPEKPVPLT